MRRRARTRRNYARDGSPGACPWDQSSARLSPPPPQEPQGLNSSSCSRDFPGQASPRSTADRGGVSRSRSREGCGTEEPEGAVGGQAMQDRGSASRSAPLLITLTDRSRAVRYRAGHPASQMRVPSPWPQDGGHTSGSHGLSVTQSDSAISRQELVGRFKLFYGANMGSETRNVEFKLGGGEYLRSGFRFHLRRYACAFLNSGGGGTLLVGVDDEGVVRGLQLSHRQEDQVRLLVDSVLRGFRPPLLPHKYSLRFIPVVRPGPLGRDLKVLALHVGATTPAPSSSSPLPHPGDVLYQTDLGDVFLRRDGSVDGPLSAGAIQEWARQRWSGEVGRLQGNLDLLLSEQRLLTREVCLQNRTIAALHRQLRRRPPSWDPTAGAAAGTLKKRKTTVESDTTDTDEESDTTAEGTTSAYPLLSPRVTNEPWEVGKLPGCGGTGLVPAGQDPNGSLGGVLCRCKAQDPGATRRYRLCHLM
ncbi:unnamed protein product [Boreogadus saida]